MKVALIGDVHANLPALEAVLSHADARGADDVWNIGDFVGYGAYPDETVKLVRRREAVSIAGNYDLKVLEAGRLGDKWKGPKNPEKRLAFTWAYDHLSPANRKYLASLPQEIRLTRGGLRILLTHGSPQSNEEHLTSETPISHLRELAAKAKVDIVICGHSHSPFARKAGRTLFINTGSVGRPGDGDTRASYAILTLSRNSLPRVKHYRVACEAHDSVHSDSPTPAARLHSQEHFVPTVSPAASVRLAAVTALAKSCNYEIEHTHQVTRTALALFRELKPLHKLGPRHREFLLLGSLLHDIGWIEGRKRHHKTALRLILESPLLPFSERERLVIGSIARYHRRALPAAAHKHFAALNGADRKTVSVLSAILRVADGLDRSHRSLVKSVSARISSSRIRLLCMVSAPAGNESKFGLEKGDLMRSVFKRSLEIECRPA